MSNIILRIAAKTDVGLARQNNEDNFQASADLSTTPMSWVNNKSFNLGEKGTLLVVADGMGGMNAGEVASAIAIETVRDSFVPERLTPEVTGSRFTIEKFMNNVIVEADQRIKAEGRSNPESRGMGTTIVIAWLIDGMLYVSWCGDSRAYVYNPMAGLHQISKDHSYVQQLVDKGSISPEDAFDYPESNIITRCLSDATQKARPESLLHPYQLCNGDIVMLCTDGLSGMLRDPEMEAIIRNTEQDMDVMTDALIRGACDASGSDNITLCVAQIMQGAAECNPAVFEEYDRRLAGPERKKPVAAPTGANASFEPQGREPEIKPKKDNTLKYLFGAVLAVVVLAGLGFGGWKYFGSKKEKANVATKDSLRRDSVQATNGTFIFYLSKDGKLKPGLTASPDGNFDIYRPTDSIRLSINRGKIDSIIPIHSEKPAHVSQQPNDNNNQSAQSGQGHQNDEHHSGIFNQLDKPGQGGSQENKQNNSDKVSSNKNVTPGGSNNGLNEVIKTEDDDETLAKIAKKYNVKLEDLKALNKGYDAKQKLKKGTRIILPTK